VHRHSLHSTSAGISSELNMYKQLLKY